MLSNSSPWHWYTALFSAYIPLAQVNHTVNPDKGVRMHACLGMSQCMSLLQGRWIVGGNYIMYHKRARSWRRTLGFTVNEVWSFGLTHILRITVAAVMPRPQQGKN